MSMFDADTLGLLRRTREVRLVPAEHPQDAVTIWVVVVGDDAFIRSIRGPKARWYKSATADGNAVVEAGEERIGVRLETADAARVEPVSRAFLAKYRDSPYAEKMVLPNILSTTLRMAPA